MLQDIEPPPVHEPVIVSLTPHSSDDESDADNTSKTVSQSGDDNRSAGSGFLGSLDEFLKQQRMAVEVSEARLTFVLGKLEKMNHNKKLRVLLHYFRVVPVQT